MRERETFVAKKHPDHKLHTACIVACVYDNVETVRSRLSQGTDPNTKDEAGQTPLHYVCRFRGPLAIVRLLLDAGADPNVRDMAGYTPFHWACISGRAAIVRLLLDKGADVNAQDNEDDTPLSWIKLARSSLSTCERLIDRSDKHSIPLGLPGDWKKWLAEGGQDRKDASGLSELLTSFSDEWFPSIAAGSDGKGGPSGSGSLAGERSLEKMKDEFNFFRTAQDRKRFFDVAERRYATVSLTQFSWEQWKKVILIYVKMLVSTGNARREVLDGVRSFLSSVPYDQQKSPIVYDALKRMPYGIVSDFNHDVKSVMTLLDRDLFGLEDAKKQVFYELVLAAHSKEASTPAPLLLVGPPGTGKTAMAQAVASAIGLPFHKVSFSGNSDIITMKGSNYGWSNASMGVFTRILLSAGCLNPVVLLDEVDKAGGYNNGNTIDVLTEVLDANQSWNFSDQFLMGVPVDLSKVFFIATANDIEAVPGYVRDRCRVINISQYSESERKVIIRDFMPGQVCSGRSFPFTIDVTEDVAARIARRTESLRIAKEMVTTLVADELAHGMAGKHTPARENDTIIPSWNEEAVSWFTDCSPSTMGFRPPPVTEDNTGTEEDISRKTQSPFC